MITMKKNALYFTIILAIFLIFGHCSCSQEQGVESVKYGSIQGKVLYSNGSDHSGITVTLDRTDGLRVIGGEDGSRAIVSMMHRPCMFPVPGSGTRMIRHGQY